LITQQRSRIRCAQQINSIEGMYDEATAMKASVLLGFAGIITLSLLEASIFIFAILSVLRVF
jgi:hypothetical protein